MKPLSWAILLALLAFCFLGCGENDNFLKAKDDEIWRLKQEISSLKQNISSLEQELKEKKREADRVPSLENDISSLEREVEDLKLELVARSEQEELIRFSIPIADGIFTIAAGDFQSFKFEVTDDMVNPIVEGEFEVLAGVDVEVCVFDEINFKNWKAGVEGARAWFCSGKVAAAKIKNLRLNPDVYYLVLINTFSLFTKKKVQVKVELNYSKWV